ncbi:MAG: helix-turn-helix transcriptional regulator [Gaiellaceae bacterium]
MLTTLQLKRIMTGLSQEEFAAKIGVSRQTISSVERRLSDPSVRLALVIARALETTVEEIFGEVPLTPNDRSDVLSGALDPTELREQFVDAGGVGVARGA